MWCCCFQDRVSLSSSGCPVIHYEDQASLELRSSCLSLPGARIKGVTTSSSCFLRQHEVNIPLASDSICQSTKLLNYVHNARDSTVHIPTTTVATQALQNRQVCFAGSFCSCVIGFYVCIPQSSLILLIKSSFNEEGFGEQVHCGI